MQITEIYKTTAKERIQTEDLKEFKNGLTIHKVKIIGKKRQGILLSFVETHLEHKCNRTDAFAMAKKFETGETEDFVGKKVWFVANEDGIVRLSLSEPKTDESKTNDKKKV